MPLFEARSHRSAPKTSRSARLGFVHRRPDTNRVAGGYKAALTNPNTSRSGRQRARQELRAMGRDTHVPLMTKVKRVLGIRSTPKKRRSILHMK